jgi:glutamate-1-semialdehyde 2,1-aminomutase
MIYNGRGSSPKFIKSVEHLIRAELTIPLGSQTFSKSRMQYPVGISPLYASKSKGCHLWDIDGNKFIDLVSALASVTLGYSDRGLIRDVSKQLRKAVSMSLPGILEAEVSELLVSMIPSAEMVRFGKNGSDATAAAIRLARAYTGRSQVVVCGYHGWQDWYIGSTSRNKGVPDSVSKLTHKFQYNDLESLNSIMNECGNSVAAVMMEPMNSTYPNRSFLKSVKEIAEKHGALLIFDETITGFRFSSGGAQELFGVTPHLSTFGKGMANGFPLSAVVGSREIMMEMEEIFFSGTFGGELLSLAAAKHVLNRYMHEDISADLQLIGSSLTEITNEIIKSAKLETVVKLTGHPSWKFFEWQNASSFSSIEIRTFFSQLVFERGLLVLGTHNVTLAHTRKIQERIGEIYSDSFSRIHKAIEDDSLKSQLRVTPLEPVFKVR